MTQYRSSERSQRYRDLRPPSATLQWQQINPIDKYHTFRKFRSVFLIYRVCSGDYWDLLFTYWTSDLSNVGCAGDWPQFWKNQSSWFWEKNWTPNFPKPAPPICIRQYIAKHPWHRPLYRAMTLIDCTRHALREGCQHRVLCRGQQSILDKLRSKFSQKMLSKFSKFALPICTDQRVTAQHHLVIFSFISWGHNSWTLPKKFLHSWAPNALQCSGIIVSW